MSVLLVRVSGVAMLERSLSRKREGYADYVARAPAPSSHDRHAAA